MVVTGYRIRATGLEKVMEELGRAQADIKRIAEREYRKLLGEKAAFICDNIALNVYKRNPGGTVMDDAVKELAAEMDTAIKTGARSPLNFQVYAYVMPYGDCSYIRVICPNEKFLKAFKRMEPYSLTEEEGSNRENAKTKTWMALFEDSKKREPLSVNLTHIPAPEPGEAKYPKVAERAEKAARHALLNRYMNLLSGGKPIQPPLMMEYVDRAMEMLLDGEGQRELKERTAQLLMILPDLNSDPSVVTEPYGQSRGGKAGGQPDPPQTPEITEITEGSEETGALKKEEPVCPGSPGKSGAEGTGETGTGAADGPEKKEEG